MKAQIINTKFGQIEFTCKGKGKPIMFIHGGHSNCNETLCIKGFNQKKHQLIIASRPGYGNTPLTENKTPRQAAELFNELINHLSLAKVIVYGISAGGLTAIELSSSFPNKVSRLILASAITKKWLSKDTSVYKTAKKMFNPKTEKIIWAMVNLFASIFPFMIAKSFHPQFSKKPLPKLNKNDVNELASTMKHYASKKGFMNDIDQTIDESALSNIKCPTFIIHSENDNSVSLEHAMHAHNLIENSKLEIINNEWGHLIWLGSDSALAIKKITNFIENDNTNNTPSN